MGNLLTRKAQIAVKVETTEGTAVTLGASSAGMLVYDPVFTPGFERFVRNPARAKLTPLGGIIGKRTATISFKTELKGSGSTSTVPAWSNAVRACGFTYTTISSMTVSGLTGSLVPGDTITGSSSGATARVVGEWDGGATSIRLVPLTSTPFESGDVITGAAGGTCSFSAVAVAGQGFEYRPVSSNVPSVTVGLFMDGLKKTIRGARGTMTIEGTVGEPVMLNFTFSGVYDNVVDAALLTGVDYEDNDPVAFLNVDAIIGDLAACFASANIDVANSVVERECANNASGVISYFITERAPTLSLDPEMELVATHDFYGRLLAQTNARFYFELPGSTVGTKVGVAAPRGQYTNVGEGDRNGLAVADLEVALVSASVDTGDDELQIAVW